MLAASVAAFSSCDAGKQHDQPTTVGPPVRVLGVSVGPDRPMPVDGVIQIAFDRYLLPATVVRQSAFLLDSSRNALPSELQAFVQYDPITRTVTLARPTDRPEWLTEGQAYTLILPVAEGDSDQGGFRAIDRAPLLAAQPREIAFMVGPRANVPPEPTATFCRDVLPLFAAKCSLPTCHGSGNVAAAGLILDTSAGVSATAIARIAQGSNTGAKSTQPPTANRVFGVDMPLIDPGNPGNSWLLYKIELAPLPAPRENPPRFACLGGLSEASTPFVFTPLVQEAQRAPSDAERANLGNFILGREMPFPVVRGGTYSDDPLTFEEREKIRIWIQSLPSRSTTVPECGGCGALPDGDAGADAAANDASANDGGDAGPNDASDDAADANDQ